MLKKKRKPNKDYSNFEVFVRVRPIQVYEQKDGKEVGLK